MGIREVIKGKQGAVVALAIVMIVGAGVAIFLQWRRGGPSSGGSATYFTTDEGQNLFVDTNAKLPPFERDGRQAVRAHVFECGGKRVVGYLSRYTEEAKAALAEAKSYQGTGKPPPNARALASIGTTGLEIKRPGDPQWVKQGDVARATRIRTFRCPDGSTPAEVYP